MVAPNDANAVWINQDAWFSLTDIDAANKISYQVKKEGNGVYAFVLEGNVTINGEQLNKKDALGIWEVEQLEITAGDNAKLLLIDVPMKLN